MLPTPQWALLAVLRYYDLSFRRQLKDSFSSTNSLSMASKSRAASIYTAVNRQRCATIARSPSNLSRRYYATAATAHVSTGMDGTCRPMGTFARTWLAYLTVTGAYRSKKNSSTIRDCVRCNLYKVPIRN